MMRGIFEGDLKNASRFVGLLVVNNFEIKMI
jgi:hypothetical protein